MICLNQDLCNANFELHFEACFQYIQTTPSMQSITPKVDFRKYYGPAESQCKFCCAVTVYYMFCDLKG